MAVYKMHFLKSEGSIVLIEICETEHNSLHKHNLLSDEQHGFICIYSS